MDWRYGRRVISGLLAAAFIFAVTVLEGCKVEEVESRWVDTSMDIDGFADDWETVEPVAAGESTGAYINVANDSLRLYLMLSLKNPMEASSIKTKGLMIWVNSEGKKNKDLGLRLALGLDPKELQGSVKPKSMPNRFDGDSMDMPFPEFSESKDTIEEPFAVIDKDWWYQPLGISTDGENGPEAAFGREGQSFVYEISIPFHGSGKNYFCLNADPGGVVTVGFEWSGPISGKSRTRMMLGGPGLGVGGSGSDDMGDMPMPGGGPGDMPGMDSKKHEVWFKVHPATAPQ